MQRRDYMHAAAKNPIPLGEPLQWNLRARRARQQPEPAQCSLRLQQLAVIFARNLVQPQLRHGGCNALLAGCRQSQGGHME